MRPKYFIAWKPLLLIGVIWCWMIYFTNPIGQFPLNDDWVYALTIEELFKTGKFILTGGANINLLTHAFWGAGFSLLFGQSFTVLRVSTLVAGLLGLWATFELFRECSFRKKIAFFGTCIIAVNPIYLNLSHTFMSDVPFYAATMTSLFFLVRTLKYSERNSFFIGMLFAFWALLNRQIAFAIFPAFSLAYWMKTGFSRKGFSRAFLVVAFACLVQLGYQYFLRVMEAVSISHNQYVNSFFTALFGEWKVSLLKFRAHAQLLLIYLGLFLFPWILVYFKVFFVLLKRWERSVMMLLFGLVCLLIWHRVVSAEHLMPYTGNILHRAGTGPLLLRDVVLLGINFPEYRTPRVVLEGLWKVLTVVGHLGGLFFVGVLLKNTQHFISAFRRRSEEGEETSVQVFLFTFGAIYFTPIMLTFPFDRYLLPLIPVAMLLTGMVIPKKLRAMVGLVKRSTWVFVGGVLVLVGGLSVAMTHDYLEWNRVRWQSLHYLMNEKGITPDKIDGGYEFNGWHLYDKNYEIDATRKKSYWWVDEDEFLLSFGMVPGYKGLWQTSVKTWLPTSPKRIVISKKEESSQAL